MIVEEVMNPDVKTIDQNATVREAAEEMKKHKVGCLIVVNNTKLLGILTERDIMDKVIAEGKDTSKVLVKQIMTREVIMVGPDKDVIEAAELMIEKKIKKLPVIQGSKLIGIVTAMDLCSAEPKLFEQIAALIMIQKKKPVAG